MHPVKMMMESKLEVHKDKTLREATEMAYKVCRLPAFPVHLVFQQRIIKSVTVELIIRSLAANVN